MSTGQQRELIIFLILLYNIYYKIIVEKIYVDIKVYEGKTTEKNKEKNVGSQMI